MSSSTPPQPTFLIIGAARCATRWLRFNLNQHPDVFLPAVPLDYFAPGIPPFEGPPFDDARRSVRQGVRWYRLQFVAVEDQPVVGEASPGYLAQLNRPGGVAERIDEALPGVKLVAVVRHPVDRMYSALLRAIQTGLLPVGTDLVELVRSGAPEVETLDLIGGGQYAINLHPYVRRFGDRLLILRTEDVRDHPDESYARVLAHIGAEPGFQPDGLERVRFASRNEAMAPPLDDQARRQLFRHFRADVEELEVLLDWDLSDWDPGPAPFSAPAS
jgi:hypothetical protein